VLRGAAPAPRASPAASLLRRQEPILRSCMSCVISGAGPGRTCRSTRSRSSDWCCACVSWYRVMRSTNCLVMDAGKPDRQRISSKESGGRRVQSDLARSCRFSFGAACRKSPSSHLRRLLPAASMPPSPVALLGQQA
jgi:hypothetical protein